MQASPDQRRVWAINDREPLYIFPDQGAEDVRGCGSKMEREGMIPDIAILIIATIAFCAGWFAAWCAGAFREVA